MTPPDPPSTGARLRAVAPPSADAAAARLRQRVRASLAGRSEAVRVGRYVLGDRVGAGGMGTVYRARDEQLERDVAVKLVPLPPAPMVERAVREARAMAGIVHPNVVEVFDVGVEQTELYIVMRLLEGDTLRTWAADDGRGLAPRLDALLAAGEGLAAAHAAGFIHHDFKPDNVLVADDGRVAVTDFGLAALIETPRDTADVGHGTGDHGTTEDDGIGGTRGYASPERRDGHHGDARSDQFSWCVTAYEVLYGERPEASARPPVRSSRPGVGRIPGRVRRALERGLSEDPAQRFADLRALLAACRPASRRRAAGLVVAATCGLGLVLASVSSASEPAAPPASDAQVVLRIPASELAPIHEALAASEAAHRAGDAAAALEHAQRASARVEALGAERLRGDVGLATGRALESSGRYSEAAAAFDTAIEFALAHEDDGLAARAASELVWIHGTRLHEPAEARRWAKAALLYLERGGDFLDAGAIHYRLGTLATEEGQLDAARVHFEDALAWDHGELAGDDRSIAASLLALGNLDLQQGDVDAALVRLERTRARLLRTPDDVALASVYSLLAQIAHTRSEYARALDLFDEALALHERTANPHRAYELCNSARVLASMGRDEEALERARESLSIIERSFGETSVETTVPLAVIAGTLRRLGALEEAERMAWRAVIALESAGRTDSPSIAGPLMRLGEISIERGHVEQGVGHLERSLEIRRRHSVRPAVVAATLMALAEGLASEAPSDAAARAEEAADLLDAAGQDASEARRTAARLRGAAADAEG